MRVSDVMIPDPVQVTAETPLGTCALRMEHLGLRHLPMVRPDGGLAGLVTDAEVHRLGCVFSGVFVLYEPEKACTARDVAVDVDVVIGPDDDLVRVLRRLALTRQDCAVVVDGSRHPVGLLTEHHLLKAASALLPAWLTVDQLPWKRAIVLDQIEPASSALEAMLSHRIRHVPVTGPKGALVGVVSLRDLVAADVPRRSPTLDEVRSAEAFSASPEDRLVDCAARMLAHQVGCLPVVHRGRVVRIVTRRDLLEAAANAIEDEELFDGPEAAGGPGRETT